MSLFEILAEAVEREYEYVLITDHTTGLRFGGLDSAGLQQQRTLIEEARARFPDLLVLQGAELNIDRDGSLDIDDESLGRLDFAVAGLHSHFDLGRSEQTPRVLRAVSHPAVRVLAHPTGRRIETDLPSTSTSRRSSRQQWRTVWHWRSTVIAIVSTSQPSMPPSPLPAVRSWRPTRMHIGSARWATSPIR